MRRFRIPLILLAVWCGLTWLPFHGLDDEPLVLTEDRGSWTHDGVTSTGLTLDLTVSSSEANTLRSWPHPIGQTPFAVERIWIVGLQDERLLRTIGIALAQELTAVRGVEEVAWFPQASQPLDVKRSPDLWVVLDLIDLDVAHIPGYCRVKTTLRVLVGRNPLSHLGNDRWRFVYSSHRSVEVDSSSYGILSAASRYARVAKTITQNLDLAQHFSAAALAQGIAPSPPLDPAEPLFQIPPAWTKAVGPEARLIQRGIPPGMEGEALWQVVADHERLFAEFERLGFHKEEKRDNSNTHRFQSGREMISLINPHKHSALNTREFPGDRTLLLWRKALDSQGFSDWFATSLGHERAADTLLRANPWPGSEAEAILSKATEEGVFPGAVALMGTSDGAAWALTLGQLGIDMPQRPSPSTLYDLASLTKVLGATPLALLLEENGEWSLTDSLGKHLPAFIDGTPADSPKRRVQLDHLLTHTSGLPSWKAFYKGADDYSQLIALIQTEQLEAEPGERRKYSDLGLILLGAALVGCSGESLASLETSMIFEPLYMLGATRNPNRTNGVMIAPTESRPEGGYYHGVVHDENSRVGGGQTAHAGLFASGLDLASYCREWLKVERGASRVLPPSALRRVLDGAHGQLLGWQRAGERYPGLGPRTLYHTGFTGTALWIDPDQDLFLILLTNRVHPTREGAGIGAVRRAFVEAALADRGNG